MTTHGQLKAAVRNAHGKGVARKLRAQGQIPGIVYGRGKDNLMLSLDPAELRKAMDPARKLNTFFQLDVANTTEPCIIADYQMDPIRDEFLHVDFLRVDPEAEVFVKIPVRYTGRAVGVVAGGKLKTTRREVRIAAKPGEIPVEMLVDVTPLNGGDKLRFGDIALTNARLLENPDIVVALVEAPKAAKEDAGAAAKKGKKK